MGRRTAKELSLPKSRLRKSVGVERSGEYRGEGAWMKLHYGMARCATPYTTTPPGEGGVVNHRWIILRRQKRLRCKPAGRHRDHQAHR